MKTPLKIRDRIKAFKRVKVKELLLNPKNWRGHGDEQREFLRWIWGKVGIAGALLVRETKAGLMLIDGQMRREELEALDPEHLMPVQVLDVTAKEADMLLATMDRITALASRDDDKLDDLMASLELTTEDLPSILAKLSEDHAGGTIPELYQVVVECQDEQDQQTLYERLKGEGRKCRLLTV